ncbi:MAG TPA: PIN domain-containing protein [Candidatus Methylacidiphilales bacterium]|jgi:predicted nucleic acid-binding protein|nr:PIN domain-containing protein [Candidatus Methylacidiphilales bacterium]
MGWLIDTSIWIAVERGNLAAADIHAITKQDSIYLSPVNIAEMQFGLEMLKAGAMKQRAAAALRRLRRKPQLRITAETGEIFGGLASKLKKAGRDADFRINDLWIAAQAIQRGFSLLTSNSKDFADIPELKLVAVRIP